MLRLKSLKEEVMDQNRTIALEQLKTMQDAGLFDKEVNLENILSTAIPSRIEYFEQATRDHQLRRAKWMLITSVNPQTLGENFYEMSYPPLQMNQFYKDVKEYFSPLIVQLGLKFGLLNPQYYADGRFEMILKGEKTETTYTEKDPSAAYTWMVGFINTHPDMVKGTYLINLAPFSGRGYLVVLKDMTGDKLRVLEKMLVFDRSFSCGSWSGAYATAQGMDDVNWGYGLIEVAGGKNGIFFSYPKGGLNLVYADDHLRKKLAEITSGTDAQQMPSDYFSQYVVNKLNELDPSLIATYVKG